MVYIREFLFQDWCPVVVGISSTLISATYIKSVLVFVIEHESELSLYLV